MSNWSSFGDGNSLKFRFTLFVFTFFISLSSFGISKTMLQFVEWEANHNPGYLPFTTEIQTIPYVEVQFNPKTAYIVRNYMMWHYGEDLGPHGLTLDFAHYIPKKVKDLYVYQKGDKIYFRWFFHPMDKLYYKNTIEYFKSRNMKYKYYGTGEDKGQKGLVSKVKGFFTASKSFIINVPGTNETFSMKTGTSTMTQQELIERPNPSRWTHLNRMMSDYYYSQRHRLQTLDVAWEAGAIIMPPLSPESDNGQNIRLMEKVSKGEVYQMTGFVLNDKSEVARIAKIAGMTSTEFVGELSENFGKFLVELNLILGFRVTSSHLQNVRFELDLNMRPTGKVILLDLTDGSPIAAIWKMNKNQKGLDQWREFAALSMVSGKFPNQIFYDPVWKQGKIIYSGKSGWLKVFDKQMLQKGALDRAKSLGDFKNNVTTNRFGEIKFDFKSESDLIERFKMPGRSCLQILSK